MLRPKTRSQEHGAKTAPHGRLAGQVGGRTGRSATRRGSPAHSLPGSRPRMPPGDRWEGPHEASSWVRGREGLGRHPPTQVRGIAQATSGVRGSLGDTIIWSKRKIMLNFSKICTAFSSTQTGRGDPRPPGGILEGGESLPNPKITSIPKRSLDLKYSGDPGPSHMSPAGASSPQKKPAG